MTSITSGFPVTTLQWMACNLHNVDVKLVEVTFSLPILRISLGARILIRLKPQLITIFCGQVLAHQIAPPEDTHV